MAYSSVGIAANHRPHDHELAIEAMRRAVVDAAARGQKLTIIALGPLNNLAALYQSGPFYARHSRVITMGGWFHEPGQPLKIIRSGYNWGINPVATQIVLDSQVEMLVFPASMTEQGRFWVDDAEWDQIRHAAGRFESMHASGQRLSRKGQRALAMWNDWQLWNAAMFAVGLKKKLADPATVAVALFPERVTETIGVRVQYPVVEGCLTDEAAALDCFRSKNDLNLVAVVADNESPVRLIATLNDDDGFLRAEIMSAIMNLFSDDE